MIRRRSPRGRRLSRVGRSSGLRLGVAGAIGVVAASLEGALFEWELAVVTGWIAASVAFLTLTWSAVGWMDHGTTAKHATREDPTSGVAHIVLVVASLASLAGVALMLLHPGSGGRALVAALGVLSVAASWCTVHTIYTLRYAAAYYGGEPGGISFNQSEPPSYADFAYVGFTVGMSYQVADTNIETSVIRRIVLRHSLLSYLLGAVVLAITINLVGSLAK